MTALECTRQGPQMVPDPSRGITGDTLSASCPQSLYRPEEMPSGCMCSPGLEGRELPRLPPPIMCIPGLEGRELPRLTPPIDADLAAAAII